MGYRVDDRFAHGRGRQAPAFLAAHGTDLGAVQGVLVNERARLVDGAYGKRADLSAIDNAALVGAVEAAGLDPGVREVAPAVLPEEEHPAHGRDLSHSEAYSEGDGGIKLLSSLPATQEVGVDYSWS
jgi:hypothetical protein